MSRCIICDCILSSKDLDPDECNECREAINISLEEFEDTYNEAKRDPTIPKK